MHLILAPNASRVQSEEEASDLKLLCFGNFLVNIFADVLGFRTEQLRFVLSYAKKVVLVHFRLIKVFFFLNKKQKNNSTVVCCFFQIF